MKNNYAEQQTAASHLIQRLKEWEELDASLLSGFAVSRRSNKRSGELKRACGSVTGFNGSFQLHHSPSGFRWSSHGLEVRLRSSSC